MAPGPHDEAGPFCSHKERSETATARPVQSEWRIQLHLSPPCKPGRSTTILYLHHGRPACNGLLKSKSLIWDVGDHSVRADPVRAHLYWVSSNAPIVAI